MVDSGIWLSIITDEMSSDSDVKRKMFAPDYKDDVSFNLVGEGHYVSTAFMRGGVA